MLESNVCLKVFLLIILFASLIACQKDDDHPQRNFVAYSWTAPGHNYSNIIPFYWLKSEDFHDLNQFVADAKTATDLMPEGHRVLFSWNLHRSMAYQVNGDFLFTKLGDVAGCDSESGFVPYRSLWWDNGVAEIRQRFEKFFEAYYEAGGQLDVFVLDFEQGFSYWHLKELADNHYSYCGLDAYLDAIQNDSRFKNWREQLGFDDLKTLNQWYENDHDEKWSALVWKHLAAYIDEAVYEPMKAYFPDADFSNYGYYYQNTELNFPDIYGNYRHRYTDGIHVGTHQSREIYGWVDLPIQTRLAEQPYPTTPYNAFRFALNKHRAMLVSSEVPVSPWVAYKGFSNGSLDNNDYYQELILHMLLSGLDYLLYWNPDHHNDFNKQDNRLLNDLIEQVNDLIGDSNIHYETSELAHWLDDILITKIGLENGKQLWRITANLEANQKITDYIIASNPLQLKIKDLDYDFTEMKVLELEQSFSDKGLWLISTEPN